MIRPLYSELFNTLYDEQEPIGEIGRGTHYSVLSSVEWNSAFRKPLSKPLAHKFAVVWDEDHDTRVIHSIENLYKAGLFAPVEFIGERKGFLTVVVGNCIYNESDKIIREYTSAVTNAAQPYDDEWSVEIGVFERLPFSGPQAICNSLIHDAEHKANTYLKNINNLWGVGIESN